MTTTTNDVPRNTILIGDVRERLAELPAASVDCVITSPPYFQLRDYQAPGQIGLESHINEWVDELRVVMNGLARVLKPTGSLWLNLGDSYSRHPKTGAPKKSLFGGPERLMLALIDEDGWTLRNKVVWAKTNTRPSSASDRLTCTWEPVYHFVRQRFYNYDLDVIREPHRSKPSHTKPSVSTEVVARSEWAGPLAGDNGGLARMKGKGVVGHELGKNPGDVWTMAASNFRGPHPAMFPQSLVIKPLLASCPERVCTACGAPWKREQLQRQKGHAVRGNLQQNCTCDASWKPGVVLDPFLGAGTVGVVAQAHGRDWLGIEINRDFAKLARKRIDKEQQS